MPTKVQNPPRLDANKNTTKFQDISELRSALRSQMPEILTEGLYISFVTLLFSNNFYLTSIRNQLTVHPQAVTIAPQDDRLTFLKQWLESSSGAQDLFGIWDKANPVRLICSDAATNFIYLYIIGRLKL